MTGRGRAPIRRGTTAKEPSAARSGGARAADPGGDARGRAASLGARAAAARLVAAAADGVSRVLPILALAVLPVAAFWLYSVAMGVADGGSGVKRVAALWIGVAGALALRRATMSTANDRLVLRVLVLVLGALIVVRMAGAAAAVVEDRVPNVDIGRVTIAAAELTAAGENPYTADIDPNGRAVDPDGTGFRYFGGFKYGPVMAWAHAPLVELFGRRGYYATTFIALMVAVGAAFLLVRGRYGTRAAAGAAAFMLAPSFLGYELFYRGVNDIVPIALLLLALLLRFQGRPLGAGILWGLSFGAKALPAGLLFLPLLLLGRGWRYAAGAVATAVAVHVPALVEAPRELIASLVVFNLAKEPERTSLLRHLPEFAVAPLGLLTACAALALPLVWAAFVRERTVVGVATVSAASVAVFFLGTVQVHRNYLLWAIPFLAIAAAPFVWPKPSAANPAHGVPGRASERGAPHMRRGH